MYKLLSNCSYTKVLRLIFVWAIFISFSGVIFSTNIIPTPHGLAIAPSQAHAGDICDGGLLDLGIFECTLKVVLFAPAQLFSVGIALAVNLIEYSTAPSVFNKLFDLPAVYTAWGVVRDLFNVIFIFVLLFSAFATIFQVQKYHLKNILLMVVLMALLVNFSWPLAGIIIDFSNILMLFFLGDQTGISLSSGIGQGSNFANTLLQEGKALDENSITSLIMIDIFVFIFMVTMFAVAFQLFIRTIALLVLLIFSPIGIAGAAIPKMQGLSKMWWESFTRYAFTGPIAVFMLIFASALMSDFTLSDIGNDLQATSGATSQPVGPEFITNIQQFIIPMVILWVGVIASSKLSDVGSKFVTSKARSLGIAGGKKISKFYGRAGLTTARTIAQIPTLGNAARVEGAITGKFRGIGAQFDNVQSRAVAKRQGFSDKSKANRLENAMIGGDKNAVQKYERTAIAARAKEIGESGIKTDAASKLYLNEKPGVEREALLKFMTSKDAVKSDKDLKSILLSFETELASPVKEIRDNAIGNSQKAIAALDDNAIGGFEQTTYKNIADGIKASPGGKEVMDALNGKLVAKKKYEIQTEYEIQSGGNASAVIDKLNVAQLAEADGLAKVLATNKAAFSDKVAEAGSAIQYRIGGTPGAIEQFKIRASNSVRNDLRSAGIETDYF